MASPGWGRVGGRNVMETRRRACRARDNRQGGGCTGPWVRRQKRRAGDKEGMHWVRDKELSWVSEKGLSSKHVPEAHEKFLDHMVFLG